MLIRSPGNSIYFTATDTYRPVRVYEVNYLRYDLVVAQERIVERSVGVENEGWYP